MLPYNYPSFPEDLQASEFGAFRDGVKAGDRAPKGTLRDLATWEPVKLHHQWRKGPLVLEFGSFT